MLISDEILIKKGKCMSIITTNLISPFLFVIFSGKENCSVKHFCIQIDLVFLFL